MNGPTVDQEYPSRTNPIEAISPSPNGGVAPPPRTSARLREASSLNASFSKSSIRVIVEYVSLGQTRLGSYACPTRPPEPIPVKLIVLRSAPPSVVCARRMTLAASGAAIERQGTEHVAKSSHEMALARISSARPWRPVPGIRLN